MPINYSNPNVLKKITEEIGSYENLERKQLSLKQFEVYMDRMLPFVKQHLQCFYGADDVGSLPIVSSINLSKRIVNQEAKVYSTPPVRTFTGVSEEQAFFLEALYEEMNVNAMMQKSNQYFKLQAQNTVQILPIMGELKMRVLLNHQFDVVPSEVMPEIADAYILTGYDKSLRLPQINSLNPNADNMNQMIADSDDYKSSTKVSVLWSKDFNFIFNEKGSVIGEVTPNPINILPFLDIAPAKDFEFFVRDGSSVTEFTIQFNSALTDMSQIVRMQGFAQAYMIAAETMMPTSLKIGPLIAVKMPINPNQPEIRPEFGFAQPNADISGSMGYLESLIALFLSSRGIDPKTVSGKGEATTYSSGMERLLSMISAFDVARSDFTIYENAEKKMFEIIKAYLNTYSGTDVLNYNVPLIPEGAGIEIKYHSPEMIKTDEDKLNIIERKLDLGLISKIDAIAEDRGIDREEALKVKQEIDADMMMFMSSKTEDETADQEEPGEVIG